MNSKKKTLRRILAFQLLLFGGIVLIVSISSQPQLEWSTVEKIATEYMDLCANQDVNNDSVQENKDMIQSESLPLAGIVMVITGATSGIGRSLATAMHKLGSTVVIIGRSQSKLDSLKQDLGRERVVTVLGDNADLESMHLAAEKIKSEFERIDFLVNNAGMHYGNSKNPLFWKSTKEGFDWLFTGKSYHKPRIIQVSSSYHWKVDGSDLLASNSDSMAAPFASRFDIRTPTQCARSYANSKFAQILHMRALSRRLSVSDNYSRVRILSICPSWVATHLSDGKGLFQLLIHRFALRSDGPGIRSTLNAMLLPQFDQNNDIESEVNKWNNQIDLMDFLTNTFDFYKWQLYNNFGLMTVTARDFHIRDIFSDLFFPIQIPFQNLFHKDLMIERSAPETYNFTLQESLYQWSLMKVKKYV